MLTFSELEQIYSTHCQSSGQKLYLLADHAGLPCLSRELRTNGIDWINLFGDDKRPALTSASPLLIEVKFSNGRPVKRQFLQWLQENGQHSSSVLLMASPLGTQGLAQALSKRVDGILSEGEEIVIRFFDTRVLPKLMGVMKDDERKVWLSIASGWWFTNRDGMTEHIESEYQLHDNLHPPLSLSDDQMSRLLDASEVDQIAYLLESNVPEQFQIINPVDRYRLLRAKMTTAKELGITKLGDLALYCGLALLHGSDFDVQPPWNDVLLRVKASEMTLAQAVELVD